MDDFDVSPACQVADCNHCPNGDECLCACHIDDHGGNPDDI